MSTTSLASRPVRRSSSRRRRLVAAGVLAAAAVVGSAAGASASTSSTTFYLPYHGSSGQMPTWGWGATQICVHNFSSYSTGYADLQAGVASPDHLTIPPGQTRCESVWWFGVPVNVTNTGYTSLAASGS
jgi:hypothetical protein